MSFEGQTWPTKTGKADTINQSEREANTGSPRQWRENTRENVTLISDWLAKWPLQELLGYGIFL